MKMKERCVFVRVRVCYCVWFDLKSKLGTLAMQYVACHFSHSLLLSSLPVIHTACRGTLTHYTLNCLRIEPSLHEIFCSSSDQP